MKVKLKNSLTLFLVFLFIISISVVYASADDPVFGSVTINKYSPLNSEGQPGDGITGPSGSFRPISGVTYKIYKVADWKAAGPGTGYDSLVNDITFTDATTPAEVLAKLKELDTPEDHNVTTGATGSVTVNNLGLGLYLIVETDVSSARYADGQKEAANITKLGDPFLVSVPMTNSAGDAWIYDIQVYPKNATAIIEKSSNEIVAGIGDEITYTIKIEIPQNLNDIEKLSVTDTLPVQVNFKEAVIYTDEAGTTPADESLYTMIKPAVNEVGGKVIVEFDLEEPGLEDLIGEILYIIIKTEVNKDAITVDEINNTATVDYGDNSSKIIVNTKTWVGKITILKEDKDTKEKLSGVKFKLFQLKGEVKSYIMDPDDTSIEYVVTTGSDGIAIFKGLSDGTYYIEESLAKEGYQLIRDPIEIIIANDETAPETAVTINNIKKFPLPITGGRGTIIFTVAGILIIAAGVVLLIWNSRRKKSMHK